MTEFRGGTQLGPTRSDPVEVVPYEPAWVARYEAWRQRLDEALGPTALRIEHVGSTAVPGLAAKPVVDIQVSVEVVTDEVRFVPELEALGLQLRYRHPERGWRYFRPRPGLTREVQVHVCSAGSRWERDHLLFRDYLRSHPAAAEAYAEVKRAAAAAHPTDRVAYTDAKSPFIDEVMARAAEWAAKTGWTP